MPEAARVDDGHDCPAAEGPKPHKGGPILEPCCVSVLIGDKRAARVGDLAFCVGPTDSISSGSSSVTIGGEKAARKGDSTVHKGVITEGCSTVIIGG